MKSTTLSLIRCHAIAVARSALAMVVTTEPERLSQLINVIRSELLRLNELIAADKPKKRKRS